MQTRFRRPSRIRLIICCFALFGVSFALAQTELEPLATLPPGLGGVDYLVDLSSVVNATSDLSFPAEYVTVGKIPFRLVDPKHGGHLFLKDIGWSDWESDPAGFSAAYDDRPIEPDPHRAMVDVPVDDYSEVYLLATAEDDQAFSNLMTLRIGSFSRRQQLAVEDFEIEIPRASATRGPGVVQSILVDEAQKLFLIRVPIQRNFTQLFSKCLALDVDITKEMRLAIRRPDPNRFQLRPLGLPSGVRLYAMTFRRARAQMTVTGSERDQVFVAPDVPKYQVSLGRLLRGDYQVEAEVTDLYGEKQRFESEWLALLQDDPNAIFTLSLPVEKHGYYAAEIRLMRGTPERKTLVLAHKTTFAWLPKTDRPYRDENPFGTWDFWGTHYTPTDPELTGPAYEKMGLRYTLIGNAEIRARYGLSEGRDPLALGRKGNQLLEIIENYKERGAGAFPEVLNVFHESGISGAHIARPPDVFTGAGPYVFDEGEQKTFDQMWKDALTVTADIRKQFPKTEIYFGNGAPQQTEEFLRRGFPKEYLGSRGNESASFGRLPEAQPLDFVANNAGLFMDRVMLDHYGYKDTPLRQHFEVTYPSTNPGNLSLNTQANYFLRHVVHSLVWKIPKIRIGMITDVANSYYHSHWGSSGFMFSLPNVSPKPSYVAMATLTQELDGTELSRVIEVPDAPSVYLVEFRRKAGGFVSVAWTPRGRRPLQIAADAEAVLTVTDKMGNRHAPQLENGKYSVELTPDPVFIRSNTPFGVITAGNPVHDDVPLASASPRSISALNDLSGWHVEKSRNVQLEIYNPVEPRRQGRFDYTLVEEDAAKVIEVTPQFPVEGSPWLRAYSVLRHNEGLEIAGEPTEIALSIKGNSGYGRIIFELSDASGQKWISIGAASRQDKPNRWVEDWLGEEEFKKIKDGFQSDWNTNDLWGRSFINFEGWRLIAFPLPGNYPGEGYHWPYSSQWFYDGDGVVHYPLKVQALIFTAPENVLKFTNYAPPADYSFRVRDLCVGYRPVSEIGAE